MLHHIVELAKRASSTPKSYLSLNCGLVTCRQRYHLFRLSNKALMLLAVYKGFSGEVDHVTEATAAPTISRFIRSESANQCSAGRVVVVGIVSHQNPPLLGYFIRHHDVLDDLGLCIPGVM